MTDPTFVLYRYLLSIYYGKAQGKHYYIISISLEFTYYLYSLANQSRMNDLDDFYKDEQNHHELYLHDDGSMTTMAASSPVTTNSISSSTNTNTDTNTRDSSTAPYANHGAPPFHNPNTAPSSDQQGNPITNFFSKSGHPITCVFHILFKVTAILIYLMGGVFEKSTNFVSVTVLCVICLSMDFWCVKNITGRLLVGLRWWANEEVSR